MIIIIKNMISDKKMLLINTNNVAMNFMFTACLSRCTDNTANSNLPERNVEKIIDRERIIPYSPKLSGEYLVVRKGNNKSGISCAMPALLVNLSMFLTSITRMNRLYLLSVLFVRTFDTLISEY